MPCTNMTVHETVVSVPNISSQNVNVKVREAETGPINVDVNAKGHVVAKR